MSYEYTISLLEDRVYFLKKCKGNSPDEDKEINEKVKEVKRAIEIFGELS